MASCKDNTIKCGKLNQNERIVNASLGIYIPIDESADSAAAASTMSEKMSSATESLGIDDENVEAVVGKFSLAWHSLKEVNGSLRIVI